MSIDVTIRQKLFGNKTMPLEVILGEELSYGDYRSDVLCPGELGQTEFVAYDPSHPARGFSVVWNPGEKKRISLRLPNPTTRLEIRQFYDAVARMTRYWQGKLEADGNKTTLEAFLSGLEEMQDFNDRVIRNLSAEILEGKHEELTFFSAMWAVTMGPEEAAVFRENPAAFEAWLQDKQRVDAICQSPALFRTDAGNVGVFSVCNGVNYLFPKVPQVPFGMTDPQTNKALEINRWLVLPGIDGEESHLGELSYEDFLAAIPVEKKLPYDVRKILVPGLTEEELRAMVK